MEYGPFCDKERFDSSLYAKDEEEMVMITEAVLCDGQTIH